MLYKKDSLINVCSSGSLTFQTIISKAGLSGFSSEDEGETFFSRELVKTGTAYGLTATAVYKSSARLIVKTCLNSYAFLVTHLSPSCISGY